MLKLTGFVLPDVGMMTIAAIVGKTDLDAVTLEDLDRVADYLEAFYQQPLGKYIAGSIAFTTNGGFTQPSWNSDKFKPKRTAYATLVLRGHRYPDLAALMATIYEKPLRADDTLVLRGQPDAPSCAFTGAPAYLRVSRDMLPMFTGRDIMNFSPAGESGIPVSDVILLALHALPLGCIVTQGALLAVQSDDPDLMMRLVRANLEENYRFLHLAAEAGYEKFPNIASFKTRLIELLVATFSTGEAHRERLERTSSLTAFHFSNYGSNARLSIYPLPSSTVQFVWAASKDEHAAVWRQIVARGRSEEKPESVELASNAPKLTQRNFIYEDLFDLPDTAHTFLRVYFLRYPLTRFKKDRRGEYNLFKETDLLSWGLTALFLKRIMNMQPNRIEQIRSLGDRLAAHIQTRDDRQLLRALYFERQYWRYRGALLRAMYGYKGDEPLVTFDGYVEIFEAFEEGQGAERADWNLARDLLLIRIFEQLHQQGYWTVVSEALQSEDPDTVLRPVTD
ncbi:MAG: hypothetical protein SGJ24_08420 [Chloroflexota bacterium]|nr:hypothetical protein [Chloroflexota bacterium]